MVYSRRHMIKLRLVEILEERGQTLYWLCKQTGIRYATIWQMGKGQVARLNIDTLDHICEVLECQPGDLLVRSENPKSRKRGK
jgi:putative transcriptional regulator